jgi:hypothetical protein
MWRPDSQARRPGAGGSRRWRPRSGRCQTSSQPRTHLSSCVVAVFGLILVNREISTRSVCNAQLPRLSSNTTFECDKEISATRAFVFTRHHWQQCQVTRTRRNRALSARLRFSLNPAPSCTFSSCPLFSETDNHGYYPQVFYHPVLCDVAATCPRIIEAKGELVFCLRC